MLASPRSSAGWSTSASKTGIPALAKTMAIPPPIVPAPTTAAARTGRRGVSFGTSGILATSRSPKNTWMRAFDSSENKHSVKRLRSKSQPCSNGINVAASTASIAASGAIMPRCLLRAFWRAVRKMGALCSGVPSFSLRSRVLGAGDLAGEFDGTRAQIAINQTIQDARGQRFAGFDRIALRAHLHGFRDAGKARQALCSGGAGDNPEPYLGLADLRARVSHPIVSRHRQLEPAPKGGAVNGGDQRFRAILHLQEQLDEFRAAALARGDFAEFLNVRSRDEGLAGSHEHGSLHLTICGEDLDRFGNPFGYARAQGVHRRIVDGDYGDFAVFADLHKVAGHRHSPNC